MSEPLSTPEEYELFLYSLADTFSSIRRSTLTFIRRKLVPPDMKHKRLPAPKTSFSQPNLPHLIRRIEEELLR